jgi:hypothetical protein
MLDYYGSESTRVTGEGPGNQVEVPGMKCERHCGQVQARFESLMRWL